MRSNSFATLRCAVPQRRTSAAALSEVVTCRTVVMMISRNLAAQISRLETGRYKTYIPRVRRCIVFMQARYRMSSTLFVNVTAYHLRQNHPERLEHATEIKKADRARSASLYLSRAVHTLLRIPNIGCMDTVTSWTTSCIWTACKPSEWTNSIWV